MRTINGLALTFVIIGALNWGLIGFFDYDVVTSIFGGDMFWVSKVIFGLVGLAGLWCLTFYAFFAGDDVTIRRY
ncbi:MAG: DUF378 domain-containing protein [Anaerotignum sp.]